MSFSLVNELFASDFDHLTMMKTKQKSIIVLSAMYKIKYIHKIIKSGALKCTLDMHYHSFENTENNL